MLEEDKLTNLAAAYANIGRKRDDLSRPVQIWHAVWSNQIMLGFAAAGTVLQWRFLLSHV